MKDEVKVFGARVHNLQNIDVTIPRNKLVVITGLSGSGKSSLAFDTIYAEGQRRYMETLSAYARQFLGGMERPDVDKITGLSPVISIEQKSTNKNPRSTVGTITEIYDFLRLLFARAGEAYSWASGEKMVKYTDDQILELVKTRFADKKVYFLAPVVKGRKGHYKELFEQLRRKGFLHVRINGEIKEIVNGLKLDRYKTHNIELVIDKFRVGEITDKRLHDSVLMSLDQGDGVMMVLESEINDRETSADISCALSRGSRIMNRHPTHFLLTRHRERVLIATAWVRSRASMKRNLFLMVLSVSEKEVLNLLGSTGIPGSSGR